MKNHELIHRLTTGAHLTPKVQMDAADEIIRLERENAALLDERALLTERLHKTEDENAALREALTDTIDMLEDLRDGTGVIDREWLSGFVQQHIQVLRAALPISLLSR